VQGDADVTALDRFADKGYLKGREVLGKDRDDVQAHG
jgi:hypothetical protein